jgi:hypothetical protein
VSASSSAPEAQARHCASAAAEGAAELLGARYLPGLARCWPVERGFPREALRPGDEPLAALWAQLDGGAGARAALLLPQGVLERVVAALVGDPHAKALDERGRSALCELGNIAISAVANALSERAGETVLPSVPRLLFASAARCAAELCSGAGRSASTWLVEAPLVRDGEQLRLLFLWTRRT